MHTWKANQATYYALTRQNRSSSVVTYTGLSFIVKLVSFHTQVTGAKPNKTTADAIVCKWCLTCTLRICSLRRDKTNEITQWEFSIYRHHESDLPSRSYLVTNLPRIRRLEHESRLVMMWATGRTPGDDHDPTSPLMYRAHANEMDTYLAYGVPRKMRKVARTRHEMLRFGREPDDARGLCE